MKKRSLLGALLVASMVFAGCGGGGGGGDTRSSENTMNSFGFESLSEEGAISGTAVAVTVPYQTDVKALVASFQVSAKATVEVNGKAQVSGTTPNDFTGPVTYTVKAEDGTAREYIVTATAPTPLVSFALQRKNDINVTVPALLQNGTFHLLDMGPSNTLGSTRCNTVAGTDTYVAGSVGSSYGRQKPVYWKNRALNTLALPAGATGVARELSLVNGHLYVVGDVYDGVFANSNAMPGYWLDDVWHAFSKVVPSGAGTETAIAASAGGGLNVDGSDYYSCGWMDLPSHGGKRTPAYWKNGIPVTLPVDYSSYDGAFATNIAIVGSSVYVTGVLAKGKNWDPLPVYWKDGGDPVLIPAGTSGYGAEWGYIVVGNDRYGFGMVGTWAEAIPAYWKNWQLNTLPLPSGADRGNANWIRPVSECGLAGKDVYIDGTVTDAQGRGILAYWLNGTPHTIPLPANLASNFAGAVGQQMLLMR